MKQWRAYTALTGLLLALVAGNTQATEKPAEAGEISYSYYLISCGNYIQHRTGGTPTDTANTADTFYVAGWLSAYNRMKADSGITEDTTLDSVMLWLEQYCQKNPLSNLEMGLFELGKEVAGKTPEIPAATPAPIPAKSPVIAPQPQRPPSVQGLKPLPY